MKVFKKIKRNMNLGVLMLILVVAERAASSCSVLGIYQPKLED
ncbi:cyclic lactone autoinducer peptide [Dethiosulfatibacter aminovorans DSM 17477]|uniref:Cyclic lactone autoinducer peptide n=1 Tax=Dethiosulfatibacter aminovorans DSM 17477 TaxID=1121476 RepID=A0A1M6JEU2_9FIRM|nr:cyclic lactone autoinducer peptide [Dethiosulfatibacter aminovorans]SHJ45198.1 cyclic lactone autoinducer peptide [Dethiosulfatibacter aminovorans DSM 17477]